MKDIISQALAESMESASWIHEANAETIASASEIAVAQLAQSGRLYFSSCSHSRQLIQLTVEKLMRRKLHLRPPLPAWLVGEISVDQNGIAYDDSLENTLVQLRATCTPEDCIFFVLENGTPANIDALNDFSRETDLPVISVMHVDGFNITEQPSFMPHGAQKHLLIPLNLSSIARKQEAILFILNCLSDMIETSLFGQILE